MRAPASLLLAVAVACRPESHTCLEVLLCCSHGYGQYPASGPGRSYAPHGALTFTAAFLSDIGHTPAWTCCADLRATSHRRLMRLELYVSPILTIRVARPLRRASVVWVLSRVFSSVLSVALSAVDVSVLFILAGRNASKLRLGMAYSAYIRLAYHTSSLQLPNIGSSCANTRTVWTIYAGGGRAMTLSK